MSSQSGGLAEGSMDREHALDAKHGRPTAGGPELASV